MPRNIAADNASSARDAVPIPPAPAALCAREQELWKDFLRAKEPSWWDAPALVLLTALVQHIATRELLSERIARLDLDDSAQEGAVDRLLALRDRETKAVKALASTLRLSPQARYDSQRAATLHLRGSRYAPPRSWEQVNPFEGNGRRAQ